MAFLKGGTYIDGDLLVEGSLRIKALEDLEGRRSVKYQNSQETYKEDKGKILVITEENEGCVSPSPLKIFSGEEENKIRITSSEDIFLEKDINTITANDKNLVLDLSVGPFGEWKYEG